MNMKTLAVLMICFVFSFSAQSQTYTYFTATLPHEVSVPAGVPSQSGSRLRMNQATRKLYVWDEVNLRWQKLGDGIDVIVGCVAPAYAPAQGQSEFVVNACTSPELYYHTTGISWVCLNCAASGATNLTFTGGASPYTLNSSTGSDVTFTAGSNVILSRSGNDLSIASTGGAINTDATLSGTGSVGSPLKIAQQSAATSQGLEWSGTSWIPSWGNPYTFVTTGATITTAVNEILIGTVSGNITMGLPTCDATTDMKHFKFVRNGTDAFSVTIDPSGTQTFYDGTSLKIQYGKISIDCTCRFSVGTGVWFYDNF
jgi:hypothetical protein